MLQLFSHDIYGSIRIVKLDDEYWFVAKDLAEILEYSATSRMLPLIDEEDKREINPQQYPELVQSLPDNSFRLSIINESGLYTAIFNSTKEEANKFRKWVTSEVLPSIRKTGSYTSQLAPVDPLAELRELTKSFMAMQSEINTKLLEDSKNFKIKSASHPGCYNIINSDNTDLNSAITAQQYLISKGLHNWDKRNTFSRRAANALRVGKQIEELPMYKNNVLYYPSDIGYFEETLSQLLGLN